MKVLTCHTAWIVLLTAAGLASCSSSPTKSVDVTDAVRKSLDQAGLKDVTVSEDRVKGIVTLGGHVATESDKAQAEGLTKPIAMGQVVAMQIAVIPVGAEKEAKAVNTDLDMGIEHNLDAALLRNKMHETVKYEVKNAVVTLSGEVDSQARRNSAEQVAMAVPNVKQVVNTLQVKDQKATSSK